MLKMVALKNNSDSKHFEPSLTLLIAMVRDRTFQ